MKVFFISLVLYTSDCLPARLLQGESRGCTVQGVGIIKTVYLPGCFRMGAEDVQSVGIIKLHHISNVKEW